MDYGWGYKSCRYLQFAIDKYGKDSFRYELLTVAHTQEIADYWEIYFIEKNNSRLVASVDGDDAGRAGQAASLAGRAAPVPRFPPHADSATLTATSRSNPGSRAR